MHDEFGDGLCCSNGEGYYKVTYGGTSIILLDIVEWSILWCAILFDLFVFDYILSHFLHFCVFGFFVNCLNK